MKNKTAFIFVFFANIALLVHVIIPHHHHQEFPLESFVECSNHVEHNLHKNMSRCNEGHEHDQITHCIIEAMIMPDEQFKDKFISVKTISSDMLFLALLVFKYLVPENTFSNSLNIAESFPLYSSLLASSQSLRAPPVS